MKVMRQWNIAEKIRDSLGLGGPFTLGVYSWSQLNERVENYYLGI